MKNLLIFSIVFLLISGSVNAADDTNKQLVPVKFGTITNSAGTTKNEAASKVSIGSLIGSLLTNIATLAKYTFKIASNFREIKQSAESLKPDVACLTNRKSPSCEGISCATLSKCTGTTLSDLLKVTYPFLEAVIGSMDVDGTTVKPGSLFAIVDTAEKIPGVIPGSLYTKVNAEKYKPKIDAIVAQLGQFRAKLPALTKSFNDAMAMLNGIVLSLNPEKFIDTMPIKPLPAIEELKDSEGLSEDVAKNIDTLLALPAPEQEGSEVNS